MGCCEAFILATLFNYIFYWFILLLHGLVWLLSTLWPFLVGFIVICLIVGIVSGLGKKE